MKLRSMSEKWRLWTWRVSSTRQSLSPRSSSNSSRKWSANHQTSLLTCWIAMMLVLTRILSTGTSFKCARSKMFTTNLKLTSRKVEKTNSSDKFTVTPTTRTWIKTNWLRFSESGLVRLRLLESTGLEVCCNSTVGIWLWKSNNLTSSLRTRLIQYLQKCDYLKIKMEAETLE